MAATEGQLRRELAEAFAARAHLYRLMLDVLGERLGGPDAEALLAEVCRRRGREVAAALFRDVPPEPAAVARRFLSVSPDGGDLYPHEAGESEGAFTIAVASCPLKDAWRDAGLPPERVGALCRVAGEFDRGLFEAAGVRFDNSTWTAERGGGCCRITLSRR